MQITKIEKNGCGPCVALSNMIYDSSVELAEYGAEVNTVNISTNPEAIEKYDITSVPVLIFEHNGSQVVTNGLITKERLLSVVQNLVTLHE